MPHHTGLIAILCVGFVLAFVLGLAAQRLRLSPIVGYLLAGIIAGPFTPGFVADQTLAPQLAEIGVILLMFGVGLHFSLRDLLEVRRIALPGAIVQITVATLLGWGLARVLGWSHAAGFVFGLSLSCASTVVLLRALEARRLLETTKGRIAIGWLIVEDLVCVVALVLLPVLAEILTGASEDMDAVWSALGRTALAVGAFLLLMLVVGKRAIPWILQRVAGTGSRELFTLCVLAIAMGVAYAAAELFGVSFALGAFFAGMLLNGTEFGHKAANDSLPLRDAFAVLFFVAVGMLFDPMVVIAHPLQVLLTFLIIVFGKSLAAWAIVRAFGRSNETALIIAASLAQIGEFSFILAGLGLTLGIIPELAHSMVLAGALLSILTNPLVFAVLARMSARRARDEAARRPAPEEPPQVPADMAGHAIVVGYGRVGRALAGILQKRGMPLVVVEDDGDRVADARGAGMLAVRGNVAAREVLGEARPDSAALVVFAIPNALEAGEAIARLKALDPTLTVLARAHSDGEVAHLIQHGADGAVMAERELAISLADMAVRTPQALQRRDDLPAGASGSPAATPPSNAA